jgi:hypothetical protein
MNKKFVTDRDHNLTAINMPVTLTLNPNILWSCWQKI